MGAKGFILGGSALALLIFAVTYKKKPTLDKLIESNLDAASKKKIDLLHPVMREKAKEFLKRAKAQGINLLMVSTLRSYKEQQDLYDQGRTKPGKIVTNSKPGYSYHNFGLAFDTAGVKGKVLDYNLDWKKLEKIGKDLGLTWGGTFKTLVDKPHFELQPKGKTLADLRNLYNAGKRTGEYVNLA